MPCSSFATLQTLNKCLSSSVCIPSNSSPVEVASATDNRALDVSTLKIVTLLPADLMGGGVNRECTAGIHHRRALARISSVIIPSHGSLGCAGVFFSSIFIGTYSGERAFSKRFSIYSRQFFTPAPSTAALSIAAPFITFGLFSTRYTLFVALLRARTLFSRAAGRREYRRVKIGRRRC